MQNLKKYIIFINVMFMCLNWNISLKLVKLNPSMQQLAVRCQSKKITWNRIMACRDTIGLLSLSR